MRAAATVSSQTQRTGPCSSYMVIVLPKATHKYALGDCLYTYRFVVGERGLVTSITLKPAARSTFLAFAGTPPVTSGTVTQLGLGNERFGSGESIPLMFT